MQALHGNMYLLRTRYVSTTRILHRSYVRATLPIRSYVYLLRRTRAMNLLLLCPLYVSTTRRLHKCYAYATHC